MDIIKAFNTNDLHTEVVIKGTKTDPLFRASDIGIILEINNIRMSIIDFDESERRAVSSTDSTGRIIINSLFFLLTYTPLFCFNFITI